MTSNNRSPVTLSANTQRRYFVVETSSAKVGDRAYFNQLYRHLADKKYVRAVFEHFQQIDLTGVDICAFSRAGLINGIVGRNVSPARHWVAENFSKLLTSAAEGAATQAVLPPAMVVEGSMPGWLRPFVAQVQPAGSAQRLHTLASLTMKSLKRSTWPDVRSTSCGMMQVSSTSSRFSSMTK